jgi:hypothetical protein
MKSKYPNTIPFLAVPPLQDRVEKIEEDSRDKGYDKRIQEKKQSSRVIHRSHPRNAKDIEREKDCRNSIKDNARSREKEAPEIPAKAIFIGCTRITGTDLCYRPIRGCRHFRKADSKREDYLMAVFISFQNSLSGVILRDARACSAIFFSSSASLGAEAVNGQSIPMSLHLNEVILSQWAPILYAGYTFPPKVKV